MLLWQGLSKPPTLPFLAKKNAVEKSRNLMEGYLERFRTFEGLTVKPQLIAFWEKAGAGSGTK